jgi:hypothetical protein
MHRRVESIARFARRNGRIQGWRFRPDPQERTRPRRDLFAFLAEAVRLFAFVTMI